MTVRAITYFHENGFETADTQSCYNHYCVARTLENLKNFCLGLDIRVPEVMEADVFQPGVLQDFFVDLHH